MLNIKRVFVVLVLSSIFLAKVSAQKINQFNAKGERVGVWKKYYSKYRLRYTGQFENGKEVGTFSFYANTPSNNCIIKKEFSKKNDTTQVTFYTKKGKVKSKGKMIHKNREGLWTYYFTNGKILSTEHYKKGKLDGVVENYYANGILTERTNYANGKKEGLSKIYTHTGILIEEVYYVAGMLDGLGKYYNLKGQLQEKGFYEKGKRKGKWEFFIDGELAEKKKKTSLKDLKNEE